MESTARVDWAKHITTCKTTSTQPTEGKLTEEGHFKVPLKQSYPSALMDHVSIPPVNWVISLEFPQANPHVPSLKSKCEVAVPKRGQVCPRERYPQTPLQQKQENNHCRTSGHPIKALWPTVLLWMDEIHFAPPFGTLVSDTSPTYTTKPRVSDHSPT